MSPKFKPGDKVICIDPVFQLKLHKIYTVMKIHQFYEDIIFLKRMKAGWSVLRFELAYIKEFNDKLDKLINE